MLPARLGCPRNFGNQIVLYRISEKSDFFFFFFFLLCFEVYRILVPQSGTEPRSPAAEMPSPNHWATKEVPEHCFLKARDKLQRGVPIFS